MTSSGIGSSTRLRCGVPQVIEATDADGVTARYVPLRIGGNIVIMRSSG